MSISCASVGNQAEVIAGTLPASASRPGSAGRARRFRGDQAARGAPRRSADGLTTGRAGPPIGWPRHEGRRVDLETEFGHKSMPQQPDSWRSCTRGAGRAYKAKAGRDPRGCGARGRGSSATEGRARRYAGSCARSRWRQLRRPRPPYQLVDVGRRSRASSDFHRRRPVGGPELGHQFGAGTGFEPVTFRL